MNMLVLIHTESNKFLCHLFDMIWIAKDCFKFVGKGGPGCHLQSLIPLFNVSLEMLLGGSGEMLYCINDVSLVCGVSTRFSIKN